MSSPKETERQSDFEVGGYSLDMIGIGELYRKISINVPPSFSFIDFDLEKRIAGELICATICHKINWDFLRRAVYEHTIQDNSWMELVRLSKIKSKEMTAILANYSNKDRVQASNRGKILRSLGKYILTHYLDYTSLFFSNNHLKSQEEITFFLEQFEAFGHDPQQKKLQLLFQNLTDYQEFSDMKSWLKPTIDYHLIRCFLRRGLIRPISQQGMDYIFKDSVVYESTAASIREKCSEAIDILCWITGLDIKIINRIEWWIGRSICLEGNPDCFLEHRESQWAKASFEKCPFYHSCYAIKYNNKYLTIEAPNYRGNSY